MMVSHRLGLPLVPVAIRREFVQAQSFLGQTRCRFTGPSNPGRTHARGTPLVRPTLYSALKGYSTDKLRESGGFPIQFS